MIEKKVFCESQIKLKKNYLVHIHQQQQQHRFDDTIRVILILFIFKL